MSEELARLGRRTVLKTIGAVGVVGTTTGVSAAGEHRGQLRDLRRANSKYQNLEKAEADGYVLGDHCVEAPPGGMGFHAVNPSLIDDEVSPENPAILVYERKDDDYNLVAVEYLSSADERPELFGQEFHKFGEGWALHVWAWKNNPNGMFADFNPRVSCPDHGHEE